jgi:hypothetical protein
LACTPSFAKALKVEVQCQSEQVFVKEPFTFEVKVTYDGDQATSPQIPAIKNLIVRQQRGTSQQISTVNGVVTRSVTFQYLAQSQQVGTLVLAGISADGVTAPPVRVQVVDRGSRSPSTQSALPPIFIKTSVNKQEVWQGEQIVFEFHLYFRTRGTPERLTATDLKAAFKGFISKDMKAEVNPVETIVDGQKYVRALLNRTVLFPLAAGEYEIPLVRLSGQVEIEDNQSRQRSRDPFFSFFDRRPVATIDDVAGGPVVSDPIKIAVKPLPEEGRPADFSGSVGSQFLVDGRLEKKEVAVGEPFTFSLTIQGDGNMDSVAEPKLNFPDWIETYDTDRKVETAFRSGLLHGSIRLDYVLIARQEGEVVLDPVKFSYFDPANSRYVTPQAGPFRLKINPDEGQAVTYLQGKRKRIRVTGTDFRHIRASASIDVLEEGRRATESAFFWTVLAGPWCVWGALVARRRRMDFLRENPLIARKIRSKGEIRQRLSAATELVDSDDGRFYGELENAVHDHLSAQTGTSTRGLTRAQLRDLLMGNGANPRTKRPVSVQLEEAVADGVLGLLDRLDGLRYAPSAGDRETRTALLEDVRALLSQVVSR